MGISEKDFSIDGHEYQLTTLGAKEGRKIYLRLIHVLADGLKGIGEAATLDEAAMTAALAGIIKSIDEPMTEMLYAAYGKSCRVKVGEKWPALEGSVFDDHFSGRYLAMSQWLLQCTLLNFANFFEGMSPGQILANVIERGKKLELVKATGMKMTASTGSSGASSSMDVPQ